MEAHDDDVDLDECPLLPHGWLQGCSILYLKLRMVIAPLLLYMPSSALLLQISPADELFSMVGLSVSPLSPLVFLLPKSRRREYIHDHKINNSY